LTIPKKRVKREQYSFDKTRISKKHGDLVKKLRIAEKLGYWQVTGSAIELSTFPRVCSLGAEASLRSSHNFCRKNSHLVANVTSASQSNLPERSAIQQRLLATDAILLLLDIPASPTVTDRNLQFFFDIVLKNWCGYSSNAFGPQINGND
jgi:hypothetical protein